MEPYIVLEKKVGETPLECMEAWRATKRDLTKVPLAYAGRLDPMASGALLVLIGDECKQQTNYHNLDKAYTVDILFGVHTDSGDVLGLPTTTMATPYISEEDITTNLENLRGSIELPYPHYSSKTVAGKPLHTWTLEGRLHEITIPSKQSTIYALTSSNLKTRTAAEVYAYVQHKIETITPVTDQRKALGNDFRRPLIRNAWQTWFAEHHDAVFTLLTIHCVASSGTYMRTLASVIGDTMNVPALAYHIHRNCLGMYRPNSKDAGTWSTQYLSIPRTF